MDRVFCQYCGKEAKLIYAKKIFPFKAGLAYICYCVPGDAYVFCHPGTQEPMGTLADPALRTWRFEAHKLFDQLWKKHYFTRNSAYEWLSKQLGLTRKHCHIGKFNVLQCRQVCTVCKDFLLVKQSFRKNNNFYYGTKRCSFNSIG